MGDYEEHRDLIIEYINLLEKFRGMSKEQLETDSHYRSFLNIDCEIKNLLITGKELVEIIKGVYLEQKGIIDEKYEKISKLEEKLKKIENLFKGKKGEIIDELNIIISED